MTSKITLSNLDTGKRVSRVLDEVYSSKSRYKLGSMVQFVSSMNEISRIEVKIEPVEA